MHERFTRGISINNGSENQRRFEGFEKLHVMQFA